MSNANAFKNVSLDNISRGLISFSTRYKICFAAFFARSFLLGSIANIDPFPGRAKPRASIRQFIEFAVNIPEQEPHEGQLKSSNCFNRVSFILPTLNSPTPSNTEIRSDFSPFGNRPAAIGPPEIKIVGMFILTEAINIPGTILSQLGMQTIPSSLCASTTVSTQSAISSRLGNE